MIHFLARSKESERRRTPPVGVTCIPFLYPPVRGGKFREIVCALLFLSLCGGV
jgi:hypothetical protein